ncbi:uncharacterized protein LOC135497242 [Lineus longissimus]|uniref:uncharacterized protein LOC135497242 n=1 Tax=Lineus longissimus TaxID=88925 RepID=UPI002B4EDE84
MSLFNYGQWCGKRNTGLFPKNRTRVAVCKCSDGVETCRKNGPPIDGLDAARLQHDLCTYCTKTSRKFHWCECERELVKNAVKAKCSTADCINFRSRVISLFTVIPCYCKPLGMSCKKYWLFGDADYCLKQNFQDC